MNPHIFYSAMLNLSLFLRATITEGIIVMTIKPGPKPKAESTGKTDRRQRVTPENKPKHKTLKTHKHK